ncbi:uncharacterized protein LOC121873848 isoform X2 [Homarus americanus]|nr:uncharacterized protein LOC121873848 isoform X2 [Homarus americanus]
MGVVRVSVVVVSLALVVGGQHINEDELQALGTSTIKQIASEDAELIGFEKKSKQNSNTTGTELQEFEDHAEVRQQLADLPFNEQNTMNFSKQKEADGSDPGVTTTVLPEPLPTPIPIKVEESVVDEDKPIKSRKGAPGLPVTEKKVSTNKHSTVGKKGVIEDGKTQNSSSALQEEGAKSPVSLINNFSKGRIKTIDQNTMPALNNFEKTNGELKSNLIDKKQGVLSVSEESDNATLKSHNATEVPNNSSQPIVSNATANSKSANKINSKPIAATDDTAGTTSGNEDVNYGAVSLGLLLLVALAVVVVVGYRKFKDIWMRRHYAHVNYLVDGMYENDM